MENPLTLQAKSIEELNKIIDAKLKEGYQLYKGGMQKNEHDLWTQVMVLPRNIDQEISAKGMIKVVLFIVAYIAILTRMV
ncbi:MAG: hypothetical protein OEX00_05765 [Gammaproteobacteria bacterium]|nr:hypothetical protein [Gammaproteobacteria bacterium]